MITLCLFLLLLLCALGIRKRWSKVLAAVSALTIYIASTGFLNASIEHWARDTSVQAKASGFEGKQLIVLLGLGFEERGGQAIVPTYALPRLLKSIEVYRACQIKAQCTLLISGGATGLTALTEAEVYRDRILQAAPDLEGHIELETRSRNTWENASFSSEWAKTHGYDQARLVTSLLHMRRSQAYFQHFTLTTSAEFSEQSIGPSSWLPSAWNLSMVDVLVHELIGLLRYDIYEAMGWNAPLPISA